MHALVSEMEIDMQPQHTTVRLQVRRSANEELTGSGGLALGDKGYNHDSAPDGCEA